MRECNIPGGGYTLRDVADSVKDGVDLFTGLYAGDLADEGTEVESEVYYSDHKNDR